MSKTQERLEDASKAVTGACRSLVKQVQAIIDARANGEEVVDYSKLSKHEFNRSYVFPNILVYEEYANTHETGHMEKQVEILQLENALGRARKDLGEMRKLAYQEDED
ncbi:unnamed protein product [Aureobasidium pullulans]|nr:unnamed protein product [Aureobasidium pullulans]CAD0019448.1 unnamed protein product [Aureobasidium pullulans]